MFIVNHPYIISAQETFSTLYGNPLFLVILTVYLSIATYTDMKTMIIPDKLNGFFFVVRLAIIPFIGFGLADVAGALFAFVVLMIPAMIKMHKMGGDIKCLTVVGLYVGIYLAPLFLILTCVYFILYAGLSAVARKKMKNVPFAPFFLASHLTLMALYFAIM